MDTTPETDTPTEPTAEQVAAAAQVAFYDELGAMVAARDAAEEPDPELDERIAAAMGLVLNDFDGVLRAGHANLETLNAFITVFDEVLGAAIKAGHLDLVTLASERLREAGLLEEGVSLVPEQKLTVADGSDLAKLNRQQRRAAERAARKGRS